MKKLIVLALVVMMGVMIGCGKEEEGEGGAGATLSNPMPLAVGNWWAYINYETAAKPDTTHDTTRIIGTGEVNNRNVYIVVYSANPPETSYVYVEDGYIHEMKWIAEMGRWLDFKMLKTPLSVGDRWTVYTESDSMTSFTQSAEAVGVENVSVPAGTFSNAIKVKYTTITSVSYSGFTYVDTSYNYVYFADNVGAVKSMDMEESNQWNVSELEGYEVH